MSKVPKFASNKKYWLLINRLVFGEEVRCPQCRQTLQESYIQKYLWCGTCRRKYRATAHRASWLYGMKLSPRQLFILLWCWQEKKSLETTIVKAEVSYPTAARWFERFRSHLPDTTPLLEGLVQVDESYFSKQRSKQAKYIVTGAIEPSTGRKGTAYYW